MPVTPRLVSDTGGDNDINRGAKSGRSAADDDGVEDFVGQGLQDANTLDDIGEPGIFPKQATRPSDDGKRLGAWECLCCLEGLCGWRS